jgi:hypothetical protein
VEEAARRGEDRGGAWSVKQGKERGGRREGEMPTRHVGSRCQRLRGKRKEGENAGRCTRSLGRPVG